MFVSLSDLLHLVTVSLGPCMLLQMALFHSFLWLSSIPLCVCVYPLHVLYLFMFNGNLGCFHALAIVNSAAVSVGVHVSFWIRILLKYIPRSGISGYMATLFLFFLRKICTVFLSLAPIYIPTYHIGGGPFSPHSLQHLLFVEFCFFLLMTRLPRWSSSTESACQCRRCKRDVFDPWVGKIPWSRKWQPAPGLPGKFHGRRSLVGYSPWGHKWVRHNWAQCSTSWLLRGGPLP